jgi:hypothetical protein
VAGGEKPVIGIVGVVAAVIAGLLTLLRECERVLSDTVHPLWDTRPGAFPVPVYVDAVVGVLAADLLLYELVTLLV